MRIILELYKNNKLLFTTDNYNTFIIPNQIFEGIPVVIPDPKSKVPGLYYNKFSTESKFTSEYSLYINLST